MKLSEYAKKQGCTKRTAWAHFKKGLIEGAYQTPSGRIVVPDSPEVKNKNAVVILFSGNIDELIAKLQ